MLLGEAADTKLRIFIRALHGEGTSAVHAGGDRQGVRAEASPYGTLTLGDVARSKRLASGEATAAGGEAYGYPLAEASQGLAVGEQPV